MAQDRSVPDAAPFPASPGSRTRNTRSAPTRRRESRFPGTRTTAPFRHHADGDWTRAAPYGKANQQNLPGRSRMSKEDLQKALS